MASNLIDFTIYDVATMTTTKTMRATRIGLIDLQCDEGSSWVFGHWRPGQVIAEIGTDNLPVGLEPAALPL